MSQEAGDERKAVSVQAPLDMTCDRSEVGSEHVDHHHVEAEFAEVGQTDKGVKRLVGDDDVELVGHRIRASHPDRFRVGVDTDHRSSAESGGGQREDSGPGADIEHAHTGSDQPGQRAESERRGRVLSVPEGLTDLDRERSIANRHTLRLWSTPGVRIDPCNRVDGHGLSPEHRARMLGRRTIVEPGNERDDTVSRGLGDAGGAEGPQPLLDHFGVATVRWSDREDPGHTLRLFMSEHIESTATNAALSPESAGGPLHAAIDIGTNSFHLVVAQADADGGFDVLTTEKEMVRLGSGAHEMKRLQPDAIQRGIDALTRMRQVAQSFGAVELVAVATSAVREASNGAEFIERARTEAGVEVEVIAGIEEARLIHLGVLQALPVFDKRLILADIGGGSTELLVGKGGEVIEARSMKLGSIRLTQRFFADGEMSKRAVEDCRRYVRAALAPVSRELGGHQPEIGIGSSGTISTIASMVANMRGKEPRTMNGVRFSATELEAVVDLVAGAKPEDRKNLPGMDPRRSDIITGGAILLSEIFRAFELDEMTVSSFALREGVLLDRFGGSRAAGLERLSDLRRTNVERLATQLDPDPAHAMTCAKLAGQLFDRTAPLHGLDPADRELLVDGAILHNVGLFISHSSHHKHGYYVIRNTDRLTGFTQNEIEIIALVARYHRRGRPKDRHPEFAALSTEDQQRVRVMAGLIRIAIGLDRGHAARVKSVRVMIDEHDERTVLTIEPLPNDDADDLELELYAAAERSKLLADSLGVEIVLQQTASTQPVFESP